MTTVKYYTRAGHVITLKCASIKVSFDSEGNITKLNVQDADRVVAISLHDVEAVEFKKNP